MSKKSGVLITVRSKSSRLPNKCLLDINSRPVISHIIERAKLVIADEIIICTTNEKADDVLCKIAQDHNVKYFRGSTLDKLDRWYQATRAFNLDYFITFDADDLFCDPYLNNLALNQMQKTNPDIIYHEGLIPGVFTYCIKSRALEQVCQIKDSNDTEMMWPYFLDTKLFIKDVLEIPNQEIYLANNIRLTLDYKEDYDFFVKVFSQMNININNKAAKEIIEFLNEHPSISQINFFRESAWKENQLAKTDLKLK